MSGSRVIAAGFVSVSVGAGAVSEVVQTSFSAAAAFPGLLQTDQQSGSHKERG